MTTRLSLVLAALPMPSMGSLLLAVLMCVSTIGCVKEDVSTFSNASQGDLQQLPTVEADYKVASGGYDDYVKLGFKPRSDLRPYRLVLPLNWKVNPYQDNNWRFQLQAWRMLNPIWGRYRETRDPALLQEALDVIRDWYRFHVVDEMRSSYQWQDMATGIRAQHLAYLNFLRSNGAWKPSGSDLLMLDSMNKLHASKLHDDKFISPNNHAIFQLHGLRLLCNSAPRTVGCEDEKDFSARHMRVLIESQFDERGVHREDSSFYHVFSYRTFRGIRMSLYPGLSPSLGARLKRANQVSPWFTGLDGNLLQFGDSEGKGVPFPAASSSMACSSTTPNNHCMISKNLASSGYASVRSRPDVPKDEGSQLFVVGSSHPDGHDHADELSFMLSHKGTQILVDGGKYGYQSGKIRDFFLSDAAHNTVGLVGARFLPVDTQTRGSSLTRFHTESGLYSIAGKVKRAGYFVHQRRFSYRPEVSLTIDDQVEKPTVNQMELRYLISPDLTVVKDKTGYIIRRSDGRTLVNIRFPDAGGKCEWKAVAGVEHPDYQGWISESYLQMKPATALVVSCAAEIDKFRTLIELK